MHRPRRSRYRPNHWYTWGVLALAGLAAILGREAWQPQPEVVRSEMKPVELAPPPVDSRSNQVEPAPLLANLATPSRPVTLAMRRLPAPPDEPTSVHSSATLLDELPPLAEEELSGEELILEFPIPPNPPQVVETPELETEPEQEAQLQRELETQPIVETAPIERRQPPPARGFDIEEFDDAAELALSSSPDDVLAYFPAEKELSEKFQPRVQQTFALARNGALHASRAQFEQLLEDLARAKDASAMTNRHLRSLAAGLRALAEADDFLVAGEGGNSAQSIAAGHQTPMLHEPDTKWTLPHEAIAMYHLYAQRKLADAVEGERAGSMVLFGLGKIYVQLSERDELPQALRKSLTMFRAAVGAHQQNHLAANEAGVLLARAGRYAQATPLLNHAAAIGRASATHRNLAYVHGKLGHQRLAQQHRQLAKQLVQREVQRGQLSAERGIAWVSPDEFNRSSQQAPATNVASRPTTGSPAPSTEPSYPEPSAQPSPKTITPRSMWW